MDNAYYKFLVHIINLCNNRITSLESRNKAKFFQSKLAKYKIEDTLLFEYPNGSIILLKDESFPQSIIDLVSNYDKLLAASKSGQPTFRITSIQANNSVNESVNTVQPQPLAKPNTESYPQNKMLEEPEIKKPTYKTTQVLNMSAANHSVKDIATTLNNEEASNNNFTDIKKKIQNLSEELRKF